jgi:uncharacterized protein YigA (DUF484 family)
MSGRDSDRIAERSARQPGADSVPGARLDSEQAVLEFLAENPDFFTRYPEVLNNLELPTRHNGKGVIDFQLAQSARLRADLENVEASRLELIDTGRNNLKSQSRVHEAVLKLLSARDFGQLIDCLISDLAVILGLDVISIAVEQTEDSLVPHTVAGVYLIAAGGVDALIGPNQRLLLQDNIEGDPRIFGPPAGLIASQALIRMNISKRTPPAILALGSRDGSHFQPGQGSELLCFLARILENRIRLWLDLRE